MGVVDWGERDGIKGPSPKGQANRGGLILVSGPSRSGKSRWAEHLADRSGLSVAYLATGADRPGDRAWQQRVLLHRQRRPPHWATLEVGGELEAALEHLGSESDDLADLAPEVGDGPLAIQSSPGSGAMEQEKGLSIACELAAPRPVSASKLLLIDSLGTWLAHHLDLDESAWLQRQDRLLKALHQQGSPMILVCEEVGWGVVPPTAIGGLFRDRSGSLQQRLMQQAAGAWLVVQGRALNLMALGEPVPPA